MGRVALEARGLGPLALVVLTLACSGGGNAAGACPDCGPHGQCEEGSGRCACDEGYAGATCDRCADGHVRVGGDCVPGSCVDDSDCNDGNPCDGVETCGPDRACVAGEAVDCGSRGACQTSDGRCECQPGWAGVRCASCAEGYVLEEGECVEAPCETDQDCSDGDPCNGQESCGAGHACEPGVAVDCGVNGTCESGSGACLCDVGYEGVACGQCASGYVGVEGQCFPESCTQDADCADGKVCNGEEVCTAEYACAPGEAVVCGEHAQCREPAATCVCDDGHALQGGACVPLACDVPQAPTLSIVHAGAVLSFRVPGQLELEVGTSPDPQASEPDGWADGPDVALSVDGVPCDVRVFARGKDAGCGSGSVFAFTYRVQEEYAPAAGEPGSTAVAQDDPRIVGWASGWVDPVSYGSGVDDVWKAPERAVGGAQGATADVVSLGEGGAIVLTFDPPIGNGPGADFAVFENAFIDTFLELAYVEVSSNGADFLRFDCAYLGDGAVGGFSGHQAQQIGSLAGSYRQGFGTPFDLDVFLQKPAVMTGLVDLSRIRYVRIVDIVGDGTAQDSFGSPIFDPYPTVGSAGFDLDGVAVMNQGW